MGIDRGTQQQIATTDGGGEETDMAGAVERVYAMGYKEQMDRLFDEWIRPFRIGCSYLDDEEYVAESVGDQAFQLAEDILGEEAADEDTDEFVELCDAIDDAIMELLGM